MYISQSENSKSKICKIDNFPSMNCERVQTLLRFALSLTVSEITQNISLWNISLCNIIDKTAAKYFTQAKYFSFILYDVTTKCTLCTVYVVNVEESEIFRYAILKIKLQRNTCILQKQNIFHGVWWNKWLLFNLCGLNIFYFSIDRNNSVI